MGHSDDASDTSANTSQRTPKGYVPISINEPPENGPANTAKPESLPNHWSSWGDLNSLINKLRLHPCLRSDVVADGFDKPTEDEQRLMDIEFRKLLRQRQGQ